MRLLAIVLCLCCLTALARAESPETLLERANQDYLKERYAAAAEGYRALVDQGWRTGPVLYNLGNAYQKLGDKGRARAAYEEALLRMPRDPELRRNHRELLATLADRAAPEGNLERLAAAFSPAELDVLASLFYWGGAGLILWQLKRRSVWRTAALGGCAVGLLFFGGLWLVREHGQPGDPAAVIPTEVSLHAGPGRDFEPTVKLHEGAMVYVLASRGDWRQVAALGRVEGWLRAEELEPVRP